MYSALAQSGLHIGEWVVIPGAGGGLGHLGMLTTSKQINLLRNKLRDSSSVCSCNGSSCSCNRHRCK